MPSNCKIFFFRTDFTGFMDDAEVRDGHLFYDMDKTTTYEWVVTKTKPITYEEKGFMSSKIVPMYFVKWDELLPINFQLESKTYTVTKKEITMKEKGLRRFKISTLLKKRVSRDAQPDLDEQDNKLTYKKRSIVTVPTKLALKFNGATKLGENLITPEMLRSTLDMRFLKSMKEASLMGMKKTRKLSNVVLVIILAAFIIGFILYGYFSTGGFK